MALNFPPSDASPWTAPNGVVYTWNTDGYWEAKADPADLDGEYLKLDASNDPVTGTCEFAGGVKVTGGDAGDVGDGIYGNAEVDEDQVNIYIAVNGQEKAIFTKTTFQLYGQDGDVDHFSSTPQYTKIRAKNTTINNATLGLNVEVDKTDIASHSIAIANTPAYTNVANNADLTAFTISNPQNNTSATGVSFTGYKAINMTDKFDTNIGFYSQLGEGSGSKNNYNFYAVGSAPNYFKGDVEIEGFVYTATALNNKAKFLSTSSFKAATGTGSNSGQGAFEVMAVNTSGSSNNAFVFTDTTSASTAVIRGSIKISSIGVGFNETSDYRLKSNIQTLPSAVELIKQLNPVSFDINGVNRRGFIAHELQQVEPIAVDGTKDEEEAIGTLADYDGTELETDVVEPSAEELEYTEEVETDGVATMVTRTRTWTPSGTRPVYQGVDQTKLIPLLTKALQEALDRIEQLESNTLQPLYASLADLPSAADHHGKVAHVHSEGALYFAHAGNWVKLQNA